MQTEASCGRVWYHKRGSREVAEGIEQIELLVERCPKIKNYCLHGSKERGTREGISSFFLAFSVPRYS